MPAKEVYFCFYLSAFVCLHSCLRVRIPGVPKLQRSELVTACEDFSNIIGCLSDGTVYKGTLSSGVEIAVASTAVKSGEDWSKKLEAQFRKKVSTLSANFKNSLVAFLMAIA